MAVAPANGRTSELRQFEERANPRYTIALDVQYKLLRGNAIERSGAGQTLNMSSAGILFETSDALDANLISLHRGVVVVEVQWPFLLDGQCPIKLVARGRVVRRDSSRVALRIERHEFHTAGAASKDSTSTTRAKK